MSEISEKSSENEILEWLKNVIGLTEVELIQFPALRFLDGVDLFKYEDARLFQTDLNIPIGLARKILKYRYKCIDAPNGDIVKWTVHDVRHFIREIFPRQPPEVDEICKAITELYIDGPALLSYKDYSELQNDLQSGENTFGIILKTIFDRFNREAKKTTTASNSNVTLYTQPKSQETENISMTQRKEGNIQLQTNLKTLTADWIYFLSVKLHLYPTAESSVEEPSTTFCDLRIFHSNWKKRNILEKRLIFFILSENGEFDTTPAKKTVWELIRSNMKVWHSLFSSKSKDDFEKTEREDTLVYVYNKLPYVLTKSSLKMRYLMEKPLKEISDIENTFLLISKSLFQKDGHSFMSLIEKPYGQQSNFLKYSFFLNPNQKYLWFDHACISYGIKMSNHQKNVTNCPEEIQIINQPNNLRKNSHESNKTEMQVPRSFKRNASAIQYTEGFTMLAVENDGAASYQCFEYKLVSEELIHVDLEKVLNRTKCFLLNETLRFACGCLNTRKNGTIMFGIGDSVGPESCYKHGEVVGFEIDKLPRDFREDLGSSLNSAIYKCFEPHNYRNAAKCISAPHFVPIISKKKTENKFVVEIDIEPAQIVCKNEIFRINRSSIASGGKKIEKSFTIFAREGPGTRKIMKDDEKIFIEKMPDIIQQRTDDEKQMILLHPSQPVVAPMDKLRKILCKGSNTCDESISPILVLGKPTNDKKEKEHLVDSLTFLKEFNVPAVFDFDDCSNYDGLCSVYRNLETSIIHDEQFCEDFSGKKIELATKLGLKAVWIFCNGRTDIHPVKPCENKSNWSKVYAPGILNAVNFYSQKEVIPKERAVVIVLLFSTNFDGLIETFREVAGRFGWAQIVVIATDSVLLRFVTEYVEDKQNILTCAVSCKGLTWEHVNSTFLEIFDHKDKCGVYLPTESGARISVDKHFIESLNGFHILSAKQCEVKEFESDKENMFDSEKENKFYRGEKVDWYNFHFQTHVLKRHCFDRLRNTIDNIFKKNSKQKGEKNPIVSKVIIAHEPGAGGTTLTRHILWEFHKYIRCAIVSKITDRTAKNILSLWQYKESCNPKPILLLIDELLQSDLSFEDLIAQLQLEYHTNQYLDGLNCCFLVCQRTLTMNDVMFEDKMQKHTYWRTVEPLKQELAKKEAGWMADKHLKLEKNSRLEYIPKQLLHFLIKRERYNQEHIQETIKGFLGGIEVEPLLEYTSLLSAYVPTSKRTPNIFIPLECCEKLMGIPAINTVFSEKNMSDILKIFLIIEQKKNAKGMQVRMASPLLAKPVLQQILENKKESLSDLTLRFLACSIIQSSSQGKQTVLNFTKKMLVRRRKEDLSDDRTTCFGPLIEAIYEQEHWINALNVLKTFFDIAHYSFVAKTIELLCSKFKDFEQAKNWKNRAVQMFIAELEEHSIQISKTVISDMHNERCRKKQS